MTDNPQTDTRTSHDPMCEMGPHNTGPKNFCTMCRFITEVRKDQTQRNIEQVQRMCTHTKYEGCHPCIHDDMAASLNAVLGNDSVPDSASVDIDAYLATLDAAGLLELHRKIIIAREQGN